MISRFYFVLFLILTLVSGSYVVAQETIEEAIYQAAEQGAASALRLKAHGFDSKTLDKGLLAWYAERSFVPFWIDAGVPTERAKEARAAIENAGQDGLSPQDYFIDLIRSRWTSSDAKSLAELDLMLTLAVGVLAADASEGRIEPQTIDAKLFANERPERLNLGAIVKAVMYRDDVGQAIRERFPNHRQYESLRRALADYRSIYSNGGWQMINLPNGATLKVGTVGPHVNALVNRLQISGDLPKEYVASGSYDSGLAAAVTRFQARHGLPPNGEVGKTTLAELNVPVEARIKTLLINLERWRWLHRAFEAGKEVLVNIAGYELFTLDAGEVVLRLPVIVGKTYHATPVFSDLIRYIEVNPYWNVPPSIASNEMLPKLKKNPGYLVGQHMRLYDGWDSSAREVSPTRINWNNITPSQMRRYAIRQDPGPWNALGMFKFVFPNSYNVYLHDTATRGLFDERTRAMSHGCIRVSTPDRLAAFLLDTPTDHWDVKRVQEVVAPGKQKILKLPNPVRVHLTYRTAWIDRDASVQFRPDLYGRDAKMAKAIGNL